MDDDRADKWWYCTKHEKVEPAEGCPGRDRLGPYDSYEDAARAYEIARQRNEAWDSDPKWND